MATVEIYTKFLCPFCSRAIALLDQKGVEYREIDVTMNAPEQRKMAERAQGRSTVPQIFVDGVPIGGCDELFALDARGALDPMLNLA